MREHVAVRCKPATANGYRHALDKVLLPAFGSVPLGGIGRDQVRPCTTGSTRRLPWLTVWWRRPPGSFTWRRHGPWCRREGTRADSVRKYKDRGCERFLSEQECRRLGTGAERTRSRGQGFGGRCRGLPPVDADRVQAQRDPDPAMGRRGPGSGGAEASRRQDWSTVDGAVAGHEEGASHPAPVAGQPVGDCRTPAREALEQPERPVACVRARAELQDVRIHDLRHSFASRALALRESLTMIGKLLGHRRVQTTARYAMSFTGSAPPFKAAGVYQASSLSVRSRCARSREPPLIRTNS